VLRWYWPRFNGYGFAAGTAGGLVTGLVLNKVVALPIYYAFPATVGASFLLSIVGTLLTPATADEVLMRFNLQINPWGFWRRFETMACESGALTGEQRLKRTNEKLTDMLALFFSLPLQISMLLMAMAFVFHDWKKFFFFLSLTLVSSVGLYFFWYRNLKDKQTCEEEDEKWGHDPTATPGH